MPAKRKYEDDYSKPRRIDAKDLGSSIVGCYPQPEGLNPVERRFAGDLISRMWRVSFARKDPESYDFLTPS